MKIKLRPIGNSLGFCLPKDALAQAGFDQDDDYEIEVSDGAIVILKKGPSSKTWKFTDAPLSPEAKEWLQSEME